MRVGRVRVPEMLQNHLLHALDIRENVVVPKPNNPPAALLEPRGAPLVVFVIRVLTAIGFDDEAAFKANEIDDEGAEAMLAAEFEAGEASVAEHAPEAALGVGRVDAELGYAFALV